MMHVTMLNVDDVDDRGRARRVGACPPRWPTWRSWNSSEQRARGPTEVPISTLVWSAVLILIPVPVSSDQLAHRIGPILTHESSFSVSTRGLPRFVFAQSHSITSPVTECWLDLAPTALFPSAILPALSFPKSSKPSPPYLTAHTSGVWFFGGVKITDTLPPIPRVVEGERQEAPFRLLAF